MKIYKYYGNSNKDTTLNTRSWWRKLFPHSLTCVLCRQSVDNVRQRTNKVMHTSEDFVLCGECGEKFKICLK